MKERPILFSEPMVRAILAGTKTQTRRVCKPAHDEALCEIVGPFDDETGTCLFGDAEGDVKFACPYGQPGDRLWVRETWQGPLWPDDDPLPENGYQPRYCEYRADGGPTPYYVDADDNVREGWRPSIHMPRWASRILLEIISVRVERLQDISEEDAIAEGVGLNQSANGIAMTKPADESLAVAMYRDLWESINGSDSWDANPWVWVVEFKRVTP